MVAFSFLRPFGPRRCSAQVLVGCEKLTVVDLDTIDVSNLNRQFLFRKKHVGKSKAEVAGEAIKRSDLGVPLCGGAFTPSTRCSAQVQSQRRGRGDPRQHHNWASVQDRLV